MEIILLYTAKEVLATLKTDPSAVFRSKKTKNWSALKVTSNCLSVFQGVGLTKDYPLTDILELDNRKFTRDNDPNLQKIRFEE
jgi:hypothetical protein